MSMMKGASRIYRLLLRAYPASFRAEYADEMVWYFEDMCRDTFRKKGRLAVLMLWFELSFDWGVTVVKERLQQAGYSGVTQMETTQFNNQYPSTLAVFSRALRGGYNVKQCLEIIAKHAPEPTKSVFQAVLKRVETGDNLIDALSAMKDDVQSPYVERIVDILVDQKENGGNLADRLDDFNREIYPELSDSGWAKVVDLEDGYNFDEQYPLN